MSGDSRDWGRIVAAIGTVVLVIFAAMEFFSEPSAEVEAEVSHAIQYQPPGVRQVMEIFNYRFYGLALPQTALDSVWRRAYPDSLLYDEAAYQMHEEVWRVSVRNEGDIAADSVVLHLPHADYARVDREGRDSVYGPVNEGVIELGALRPGRSVELAVWSGFSTSSWEIYGEDIYVSHRTGRGDVILQQPVSGLLQWLDRHPLSLFALFWLAVLGVGSVPEMIFYALAKLGLIQVEDEE